MNRDIIDMNEETNMDDLRVPTSLKQTRDSDRNYLKDRFLGGALPEGGKADEHPQKLTDQRPVKGPGSNLPAKTAQAARATIDLDENDESNENFARILARGVRLKAQMDEAIDADNAWEELHGPHAIAKKYVPPFMRDDADNFAGENGRVPDINEIDELLHVKEEDAEPAGPTLKDINPTSLRLPDGELGAGARQIHDMRYIYLKVRNLHVSDKQLLGALIQDGFHAEVLLPLPDVKGSVISTQQVVLRNYEAL
jgi:hypothetical protein